MKFSCIIIKYLTCFAGIKSAVVALLAQKAEVNYDKSVTNVVNIVKYVTDLGFQATVLEDNAQGFSIIELAVSAYIILSVFRS